MAVFAKTFIKDHALRDAFVLAIYENIKAYDVASAAGRNPPKLYKSFLEARSRAAELMVEDDPDCARRTEFYEPIEIRIRQALVRDDIGKESLQAMVYVANVQRVSPLSWTESEGERMHTALIQALRERRLPTPQNAGPEALRILLADANNPWPHHDANIVDKYLAHLMKAHPEKYTRLHRMARHSTRPTHEAIDALKRPSLTHRRSASTGPIH